MPSIDNLHIGSLYNVVAKAVMWKSLLINPAINLILDPEYDYSFIKLKVEKMLPSHVSRDSYCFEFNLHSYITS